MGTNTFKHAEPKSEEFPLSRPTVFSQTAVLSLLVSRHFFFIVQRHGWMGTHVRLHNSKWLIPVSQSPHLTKDRFAWIILSYVILSSLDVNNIFWQQHWQDKEIAFYKTYKEEMEWLQNTSSHKYKVISCGWPNPNKNPNPSHKPGLPPSYTNLTLLWVYSLASLCLTSPTIL